MWRAFFLAIGGTLCVIGAESLLLDHAVLAKDAPFTKQEPSKPTFDEYGFELPAAPPPGPKLVHPPEWAPWILLSTGAVVALYAVAYKGGG